MSGCSMVFSHNRFWLIRADVVPTSWGPPAPKVSCDDHRVAGAVEL